MKIAGVEIPYIALQLLLAGVVVPLIVMFLRPLTQRVTKGFASIFSWLWAAIRSMPNHLRLRRFVLSDKPLWSFRRSRPVRGDNRPPTLTVMNFKGGVGKTTIAANLAAAFAKRHGLRVLLIDLDYQGSLSDILKPLEATDDQADLLSKWLQTRKATGDFADWVTEAVGIPGGKLVTAEYSLTETEDRQLLRWLIYETRDDVRTRIGRKLNDTSWKLREKFDLIIMDAPPRLSIASANALKTTDYIIVPAKLQPLSSAPITKMLKYLSVFKNRVNAQFRVLGVICNMTHGAKASGREDEYLTDIRSALEGHSDQPRILAQYIPDLADIGRPQGTYLGYNLGGAAGKKVQGIFDALADEVGDEMGLLEKHKMAAE